MTGLRGLLAYATLVGLSALSCVAVVLTAADSLRVLAGVLLVVVLPGAPLAVLLKRQRISGWVAATVSVGTSLALTALMAVVLHAVDVRLEKTSWALGAVGLVLLTTLLCVVQRRGGGAIPASEAVEPPAPRPGRPALAWSALAVLLLGAAFVLTGVSRQASDDDEDFTSAWLVPAPGEEQAVDLGVRNEGPDPRRFALLIEVDGSPSRAFSDVTVAPDDTLVLRTPLNRDDGRVVATVRPAGRPEQRVELTVGD